MLWGNKVMITFGIRYGTDPDLIYSFWIRHKSVSAWPRTPSSGRSHLEWCPGPSMWAAPRRTCQRCISAPAGTCDTAESPVGPGISEKWQGPLHTYSFHWTQDHEHWMELALELLFQLPSTVRLWIRVYRYYCKNHNSFWNHTKACVKNFFPLIIHIFI